MDNNLLIAIDTGISIGFLIGMIVCSISCAINDAKYKKQRKIEEAKRQEKLYSIIEDLDSVTSK